MAREEQINNSMKKGQFLENIFNTHDVIWETDQGKSFKAFWEFLMSQNKQDEFDSLLKQVLNIDEIKQLRKDNFLEKIKFNLIESGSKVNKTTHNLLEQLSKYLSDRSFFNSRKIMESIKEIKQLSLEIKNDPPRRKDFLVITDKPYINPVMERSLFSPPTLTDFSNMKVEEGDNITSVDILFSQIFIDKEELKRNIRELLKSNSQVSLLQVIDVYPVKKGIAELIAYINLAENDEKAYINDEKEELLTAFNIESNKTYRVNFSQVIFSK